MATRVLKITKDWQKIGDGEAVVLQNIGNNYIEVATVKKGDAPISGFILDDYDIFSYIGGEEVWARCKNSNQSFVVIDNIGV